MPVSKKAIFHRVVSELVHCLDKRRTVIFDAPAKFHLHHVYPVIEKMLDSRPMDFRIIIVCDEDFKLDPRMSMVKCVNSYADLSITERISLIVKTDFNGVPYWLTAPRVHFGHGIGPKLSYQSVEELVCFDYIFTACEPIYRVQSELIPEDKISKIGLPILDNLCSDNESIVSRFNLDKGNKTIVYAPSWTNITECIGDITGALVELDKLTEVNVIVSPHPLLLMPERCGGKDFFGSRDEYKTLHYNMDSSIHTTLELCAYADVVISDISSIFFESLALGKKAILEKNQRIFEEFSALAIYDEILESCPSIDWSNTSPQEMSSLLENNGFELSSQAFISNYLFNNGVATEACVDRISEILS
ncbi:MAG: CDP-glycerol glycerophosphotransferase family protein [Pseudomonadales bacterium]|nr:CDP-glycerol glycerophosphotransferase family protein [Pseudomonadales bacterium]